MQQRAQSVVGEIFEAEGVSAEGSQSAVAGFGGSVGGVVVEVGEYVVAAAVQGASTCILCPSGPASAHRHDPLPALHFPKSQITEQTKGKPPARRGADITDKNFVIDGTNG